jgi:hypothetical protein
MKVPTWLLYAGAAGLLAFHVAEAVLRPVGHDDLWWDLAAGRYIVETGEIPTTDVFSHTFAGEHWVNQEWLSHVLFYLLYEPFGEDAIVALRAVLVPLIFAVALVFCLVRTRGSWLVSLLVTAFGAAVCREFLDARPQLFTFLFALLVLLALELFRRHGRRRPLFFVPLVLLLWAQLHGGYIFGLMLLAGNLAAETGKKLLRLPAGELSWPDVGRLAAVTALSGVAVLINPWTVEAYTHPFVMSELVSGGNPFLTVTEWQPPLFLQAEHFSPPTFWPFLALVTLASLPVAVVRWRSFDCNDVGLVAVVALFFALQHRRFIPLLVILALPQLAWALKWWTDRLFTGTRVRDAALAVALLAWIWLAWMLPPRLAFLRAVYGDRSAPRDEGLAHVNLHLSYYPEAAVRFLRGLEVPGRMLNHYNWGGYLEYFLPRHPTFIDGRAQGVFSGEFYLTYLKVHFAHQDWERILERYGVTWALIHQQASVGLFEAMQRDPDWTLAFVHDASAVFFKECDENRELLGGLRDRRLPITAERR